MKNRKNLIIGIIILAIILIIFGVYLALKGDFIGGKTTKPPVTRYKTIREANDTEIMSYDYQAFRADFKKIGYKEVYCNDETITGMEPLMCNAQLKIIGLDNDEYDHISLKFYDKEVEDLHLKLAYKANEFELKNVARDANAVLQNLIKFEVDQSLMKKMIAKIKENPEDTGVNENYSFGTYDVFYNARQVERKEDVDNYYVVDIMFFSKATSGHPDDIDPNRVRQEEHSQSVLDR